MTNHQLGFYFDQTRCTGCGTCAVACKDWHNIDAGPVNYMRVQAIERGKFPHPFVAYLASACFNCENPPCVLACPSNAISKRQTDGVVIADRQKCLGKKECGALCLNACPWKAPQFAFGENARMEKCDLCLERLERGYQTICVEASPMYALDVAPLNEIEAKYCTKTEAAGFKYSARFKPAIRFKPKI